MKKAIVVLALLLLAACVSAVRTRSIPYETQARPPKPDDYRIEILDAANVARPYMVIGVVEANVGKNHSPADTMAHLRQEARTMGGDALIELHRGAGAGMAVPVG